MDPERPQGDPEHHETPTGDRQLDDCLFIRGGHLLIEQCDTVTLAERFGTPLYVVSEDQLRRNVRRFQTAFQERWPEGPVHVLPSIKANFSLALRRILTQEGAGCDTFGPSELHAALVGGVPPELISVNGSVKAPALIGDAVRAGARITLDSVREIELVRAAAREADMRAKVRFRLRPSYEDLDLPSDFDWGTVTIGLAAQRYKPGIPTADLIAAGREALAAPELDVTGCHVHIGRHSSDLAMWRGLVRSFVALLAELREAWDGWEPREIDVGGGFAVPRDPLRHSLQYAASGETEPPHTPSIEDYAQAVTDTLRDEFGEHGLTASGKVLEMEPGRALFGNVGIHLATVRNIKAEERPHAWRWVETDTSEAFLPDVNLEHCRWFTQVANKAGAPATHTADIVGLSCGFDVVVHQAELPDVEPGDIIGFLDTGAYQDAGACNFNGLPRPATVLVHGDEAEVIKRAETVADVFARDVVPERLGSGAASLEEVVEP